MNKILELFLKAISRSALSRIVGKLASFELPTPLNYYINRLFVAIFKIDIAEAQRPLKEYKSIQDVFTRKLKDSARPVESGLCSPADGVVLAADSCDRLPVTLEIKNHDYSLYELISGEKNSSSRSWLPSWYTVVYLAPHNYHRVHSPISGKLLSIAHIKGDLWPVNAYFVKAIEGLYYQNERLVFEIQVSQKSTCYVVMIGALNVGQMQTHYKKDLVTNIKATDKKVVKYKIDKDLKAGDELGVFKLGSTVVVLFDKETQNKFACKRLSDVKIKMGQSLCKI